jgi:methyl-accepting chemotaxis protein
MIVFDTHMKRETTDLPSKLTNLASTTLVTSDYSAQEGEYNDDILNVLSGGIETLNNDIQQLSDESLQQSQLVETVNQNFAILKTSVEETNIGLNALGTNMAIIQQECLSLKQKVQERQSVSYDGTLIWKISNVQEKLSKTLLSKTTMKFILIQH